MSRLKWRLTLVRTRGNRYFLLFLFPRPVRIGYRRFEAFRALRGSVLNRPPNQ